MTTPDLPENKRSFKQDRFTFRDYRGRTFEVPALANTPVPLLKRMSQEPDNDDLIYEIADTDEGRAGLERLGSVDLGRFLKLWGQQAENDPRMGKATA